MALFVAGYDSEQNNPQKPKNTKNVVKIAQNSLKVSPKSNKETTKLNKDSTASKKESKKSENDASKPTKDRPNLKKVIFEKKSFLFFMDCSHFQGYIFHFLLYFSFSITIWANFLGISAHSTLIFTNFYDKNYPDFRFFPFGKCSALYFSGDIYSDGGHCIVPAIA